jgi:hypothetical protein
METDDRGDDRGDDRPLGQLDDQHDREELRTRYYGLVQELRVMLPGAQILVAFLLTVPFSDRFTELDDLGKALFGGALGLGALAIVAFMTPTAIHRFGSRYIRVRRMAWGVRMARLGLVLVAASLLLALATVYRFVFSGIVAIAVVVVSATCVVALWLALPVQLGQGADDGSSRPGDRRRPSSPTAP